MAGHAALDRRIGVQIPAPQLPLAPVAQLDRASDFGSEGWGFDSLRAYGKSVLRLVSAWLTKIKYHRLETYSLTC